MQVVIFSFIMLLLCSWPLLAAARLARSTAPKTPYLTYLTGFFCGLGAGNVFKLQLSRHGGVVYYHIGPDHSAGCADLPLNTPIRIRVDKGLVTSVEAIKGEQENFQEDWRSSAN
jgi:hypothetical protein